jgi:hypothetical protein
MNLILQIFMAINLTFILAFTFGRCFIFNQKLNPKLKSVFSIFLGTILVFYFISIIAVVGASVLHQKYIPICLLAFIPIPFIIGEKATYEKLELYSNMQLAMFFVSLFASYLLLK